MVLQPHPRDAQGVHHFWGQWTRKGKACRRWEKASLKKKTSLQVVKMKKKLQLKNQLLLLRLPPSMVHPLLPTHGDLDSNHFEMELKPKDKKSKLLLRGRSPRQEKPRALLGEHIHLNIS